MQYKVTNKLGCTIFGRTDTGEEAPRKAWRRVPVRRLAFGEVFSGEMVSDTGDAVILRLADFKGAAQFVYAMKSGVVFAEPFVVAVVPSGAIVSPTSSALEERLAAIEARLDALEG